MKNKIESLSWSQIDSMVNDISDKIIKSGKKYESIYGIPRGGLILAVLLSHKLNIPIIFDDNCINSTVLLVDDILDSGNTVKDLIVNNYSFKIDIAVLVVNEKSVVKPDYFGINNSQNVWITFPWEAGITDGVSKINCDLAL